MPKFLEDKLRAEYGNNPRAIYGTMNKLGAMHGNKETAKGREMERKHEADMKKPKMTKTEPMRSMRIEIHRAGPKRQVTGFTVHHDMMPKKTSKGGAFYEDTSHSLPFSANEHEAMMEHVHEHTAAQLGKMPAAAESQGEEEEAGE